MSPGLLARESIVVSGGTHFGRGLIVEISVSPGFAWFFSGEGGIRTLVTLAGKSVFETDAFNHSATSPVVWVSYNRGH